MSEKLQVAVLGVGSLGKEHARLYAELAANGQIEFAGVHDVSLPQAIKIAEKYRVPHFATLTEALQTANVFSIVTPTSTHFALAKTVLAAGKHVLLEKPMTDNSAQAAEFADMLITDLTGRQRYREGFLIELRVGARPGH